MKPEHHPAPAELRPAEGTTPPAVPPTRQPQWCAALRDAEETALVRLYVMAEDERARRRLDPRWRPLAIGLPWTVAEAY
ncbi:hypothetical protein AB0C81_33535 [Streptomyces roseoverticillatus]|uniref:hypothetical protein n=1 Tax=Streptomyces roseoverticillatus TaxID=66429 RepID=UPI0033D1E1DE